MGTGVPSSSLSCWGWRSPRRDARAEGEGHGVAHSSGKRKALHYPQPVHLRWLASC